MEINFIHIPSAFISHILVRGADRSPHKIYFSHGGQVDSVVIILR